MLDQIGLDHHFRIAPVAVLRRDEDALDLDRRPPAGVVDLVADGHLRLPVGAQVREDVGLSNLGKPVRELVREHDRQRHQLRRLGRRVPEHQPLVAGPDPVERVIVSGVVLHLECRVDALGDVRRLLVEGHDDATGLRVEAELGARVADLRDPLAHEPRDVDVGRGRDLAGDDDEARGDERLARDPSGRILGENGVENRVRDLVGDLVRMPLGHGLRGEREASRSHLGTLARVAGVRGATRPSGAGPSGWPRARAAGGRRARRRHPR